MANIRQLSVTYSGILLLSTGFCLVIAFNTSSTLFLYPDSSVSDLTLYRRMGTLLSFVLIAVTSRKLFPMEKRFALIVSSALLCLIGVAITTFVILSTPLESLEEPLFALLVSLAFLGGAASSVLYMAWIELFAQLGTLETLLCFSLSHLFSACLTFLLVLGGSSWIVLFLVSLLPLGSLLLYRVGINKRSIILPEEGEKIRSGWTFPFKPVALMIVFTFINSFVRSFLPKDQQGYATLGVIIITLFCVLAVLILREKFEIRSLYQLSLPLAVAAILCVLIDIPNFTIAASFFSNAAFTCFSIFVSTVLCSISFRYGVNPLWIFGFVQASIGLSGTLATLFYRASSTLLTNGPYLTLVLSVLILVLVAFFSVLMTDKDFRTSWGIFPAQQSIGTPVDIAPYDALYTKCVFISRRFNLTHREEEILILLAQGKTLPSIAEKLYVSHSTIKTHTQHIYKKLGVHGKQEIIDLVADYK